MPYFDELVSDDEVKRLEYASKINTSLFMTNDPTSALSIISERAAPYLTKPHLLANMNYIVAMHHLRYAEVRICVWRSSTSCGPSRSCRRRTTISRRPTAPSEKSS